MPSDIIWKDLSIPPITSINPFISTDLERRFGARQFPWQLPFGSWDYFMESEVILPRPVSELTAGENQNSPYLWGHPEIDFIRPIHARGGAWPYYWDIVSGPEGTTIGNFLTEQPDGQMVVDVQEYSMLHVPKQPEGTISTVVIRMRDQAWLRGDNPTEPHLITLQITWQADKWVFISPTGDSENTGTINNPLDWATIQETTENETGEYANKLICLMGGDYGNISTQLNIGPYSPKVFLSYPGETPVLNEISFGVGTGADDFTLMGLYLNEPNERYCQFFVRVFNDSPRLTFVGNHFYGLTPGEDSRGGDGQDNPSGIFLTNNGTDNRRYHVTIARNHFEEFRERELPNFAGFIAYNNAHSIFEMNHFSSSTVSECYFVKGPHYKVTNRLNTVAEDVDVGDRGAVMGMHFPGTDDSPTGIALTGYVEHCWNNIPYKLLQLWSRANSMTERLGNPSALYRNLCGDVSISSMQREYNTWAIWNNISLGTFGYVDSRGDLSGKWSEANPGWLRNDNNLHFKNSILVEDLFSRGREYLTGTKGADLFKNVELEIQTVFGLQNIQTFSGADVKSLPVTIGDSGRNRLLIVASFQRGGNGRGEGFHLSNGMWGQCTQHVQGQYDHITLTRFEDSTLPKESGEYTLETPDGGITSVFAIYVEGADQSQPVNLIKHSGRDQGPEFVPGSYNNVGDGVNNILVYAAYFYTESEGTPSSIGGDQIPLIEDTATGHYGYYKLNSNGPIGIDTDHEGLATCVSFKAAKLES